MGAIRKLIYFRIHQPISAQLLPKSIRWPEHAKRQLEYLCDFFPNV